MADKPVSMPGCDLSSDMDACWIKVLEPDALSVTAQQQQLASVSAKLDALAVTMTDMCTQLSALSSQVKVLKAEQHVVTLLSGDVSKLQQQSETMAAEVHEQHAYLMARRDKKAKTVKYMLSG